MNEDLFVLAIGGLLAATLAASMLADRLRLPALVLFLAVGMAIGSDGAGWIDFTDYDLARQIGTFALALILFEGGLSTGVGELLGVLRPALSLAVVGTIVTAILTGLAAAVLFGLSTLEGLLLGSILASTDGAAVFAVLRSSPLRRRLVRTLEGEAGMNDPIAVLLVVGFTDWIQRPGYGLIDMVGLFGVALGVGAAAGLLVGRVAVAALRRSRLSTGGLYPVGTVAAAAIAFGAAESLNGSGFLAVYLAGLVVGSASIPGQVTIAIFHQGAAWLAQIALFVSLGLLVSPSRFGDIAFAGLGLAVFLALLARPLAVMAATALDRFTGGERLALSWAGLRGGVPVVLATFPVVAGVPSSTRFFDVAFFIVVVSTLLQGMTFTSVARAVGAVGPEPGGRVARRAAPVARPWSARDGDPAHPIRVDGAVVVEHLRRRADAPGALVKLEDGRHAVTGTTLAAGEPAQLLRYVQERHARANDPDERSWWRELASALARR